MRWNGMISRECYRACADANPNFPCSIDQEIPKELKDQRWRDLPDACGKGKCRRLDEHREQVAGAPRIATQYQD